MRPLRVLFAAAACCLSNGVDATTIVFQGTCADADQLCEQLCLTTTPETYECSCWNDHSLLDDGLSCRLNATLSTAADRPTKKLTPETTTIPAFTSNSIFEHDVLLPLDKEPPINLNGHNFAEFPVQDSFYLESNITIEFQLSQRQDAILFFAGEFEGDDFISLAIQGPNIIMRYDCGEGAIEDLYRGPFYANQWHSLTVHRKFCEYSDMQADARNKMVDENNQFKYYKGITVDKALFVGGAPSEIDFLEARAGAAKGFLGCVRKLEINGKTLLDSLSGVNEAANREKLNYCERQPNEASGEIRAIETLPVAEPVRRSQILPTPVKFAPILRPIKSTLPSSSLSSSPPSSTPSITPTATQLKVLEFSGHSEAFLPISSSGYLELVLHYKPSRKTGVLFSWAAKGRYLIVNLENGYVKVHASMGSDDITLRSGIEVVLNEWHRVEVWRTGKGLLVATHKHEWIESEFSGTLMDEPTNATAFLGSPGLNLPDKFAGLRGFHGCVQKVVLNGQLVHPTAFSTTNVRECGSDPCVGSGCPEKCAPDAGAPICLCRWPTTGALCDLKTTTSLQAMKFSGHSYLEFRSPDYINSITGDQLRLVVEFKLANYTDTDAAQTLVFAGDDDDGGDFFRLSILPDRILAFEINLGSGKAVLKHTEVPLNRWVIAQVFRDNRTVRLSMDGLAPVTTVTPGESENLNVYKMLFIGGQEHANKHTGFSGCVRMVEVGSRVIRQPSEAKNAINIDDCSL